MTGEELVAAATLGLVVVTFMLVVVTFIGFRRADDHADRQIGILADQAAGLTRQTEALVDEARASQMIASEMLEARRSAHPLDLDIALGEDARPGMFAGQILRAGPAGVVLIRSEILLGRDLVPGAEPVNYGNFYLGGSMNTLYISEPFDPTGRDLMTLRVTGIPENGLEQSIDFQFRIAPTVGLERLSLPAIGMRCRVDDEDLVLGLTNTQRWPATVTAAGVATRQAIGGFTEWRGVNWRIVASRSTSDPALPVMLEPGAPPAEVRAALSKVKGVLHPGAPAWVWSTDGYGATRWERIEGNVVAAIAAVRRRVSVRDGAGGFSTVAIDDDEESAGRALE